MMTEEVGAREGELGGEGGAGEELCHVLLFYREGRRVLSMGHCCEGGVLRFGFWTRRRG